MSNDEENAKPEFILNNGRLIAPNGFPRRNNLFYMSEEEVALINNIAAIENLGSHPILTEVVILLSQAKEKLSDYIDINCSYANK